MPRACLWDAVGVATAPRRHMRVRLRLRKNYGTTAIWVTRTVVHACRAREFGIRFGLAREPWAMVKRTRAPGAFRCVMYASAAIAPPSMGLWSLIRRWLVGQNRTPTAACSGWRSVFSNRISKPEKIRLWPPQTDAARVTNVLVKRKGP